MDYPFAIGIIKAIEDQLLDRANYMKLIKTPKADLPATLLAMGYGKGSKDISLEALIQTELQATRTLLDGITPNPKLTDLFYLVHDAANLKGLYKERLFASSRPDTAQIPGAIPFDFLKMAILDRQTDRLPKHIQPLFQTVETAIEPVSDNPRLVSVAIDNALLGFATRQLRFPKQAAFLAYLKAFIDFQNVLTMERSRCLGWTIDNAEKMLLENGSIPVSLITQSAILSREDYLKSLQGYYQEQVTEWLKKTEGQSAVEKLERGLADLLLEQVKPFRHDAFSLGPIIYYHLKKDAEAMNLRILMANDDVDLSDLIDY